MSHLTPPLHIFASDLISLRRSDMAPQPSPEKYFLPKCLTYVGFVMFLPFRVRRSWSSSEMENAEKPVFWSSSVKRNSLAFTYRPYSKRTFQRSTSTNGRRWNWRCGTRRAKRTTTGSGSLAFGHRKKNRGITDPYTFPLH